MKKEERKFCADCRFHRESGSDHLCIHDGVETIDIVTGKISAIECAFARNKTLICGASGKHFQPKSQNPRNDHEFKLVLDEMIVRAFNIAKEHGWHEEDRNDGECLALIHSEVSEALQSLRDGNPQDKHCPEYSAVEIELADAVIRIMDYAHMRSIRLAGAIVAKMEYNHHRPMRHGGKKF